MTNTQPLKDSQPLINDLIQLKDAYKPITTSLTAITQGLIQKDKDQPHTDPQLIRYIQELTETTTQLLTNYSKFQDILINLIQTEIDKLKTENQEE